MPGPGSPVDVAVRERAAQGDLAGAATLAIREYGPGVIGWLRTLTPGTIEAEEAFSIVCERFWKALPTFSWSGSVRTWLYVTGRNVVIDHHRRGRVRAADPLSKHPDLAAVVRSTTAGFRKTAAKTRLSELRASLPEDDRTLLILRVDRQMPWRDIAEVFSGPGASPASIAKASVRARKQFERLKARLRDQWKQDPDLGDRSR